MILSTGLGAAMVACIPYVSSLWAVGLVFTFAGLGIACLWPSLQSYAADCIPKDETMLFILLSCGGIPGYATFVWGMGWIVDYFEVAGGAKDYLGFEVAFQCIAAGLTVLFILLWTTRGFSKRRVEI